MTVATVPIDQSRLSGGKESGAIDLAVLIDEMLPRIYGYLLARVGNNRAIAEDLTQESMLAAARSVQSGTVPENGSAFLYGIARHKLVDHYRQQERRESLTSGLIYLEDRSPAPEPEIERIILRDELVTALDTLPANQRIALLLHYADDLTITEIATVLEKSNHAIESLLARGRNGLRRQLRSEEEIS